MDFSYSPKVKELQAKLERFMEDYVYPNERLYDSSWNLIIVFQKFRRSWRN